MGFSVTPNFWITSFNEAEIKYNSVKPIRGKERDDIRPLGDRRAQHMRILKIDNDTYACRLYNTDVVTYYRDGTIEVSTNGWDTSSTANFASACLSSRYRVSKMQNLIHLYDTHTYMYYIVGNSPLKIYPTGEVTGYVIPTKQLVDRQASKEKREPYKPFIEFMQSYMKLLQMDIPAYEDYRQYATLNCDLAHYIQSNEPIPEDQYIHMMIVLARPEYWRERISTFEQAKAKLYRQLTEYRTVEMPVGSLQGR
jgi:hypothetical protein